MTLHSNDTINIDTETDAGAGTVIGGITNMSVALQTALITPQTGDAYDQVQSIQSQIPEIPFATEEIGKLFAIMGSLTGKCIDSGVGNPGVEIFAQKHDSCAVGARATSDHLKYTVGTGHLMPESLSASGQGNLVLSGRVHASTDDPDTSPIAVAYNASLPTKTAEEQLAVYSFQAAGQVVSRILNFNIAYNPTIQKPNYAGTLWPKLVDVQKVRAVISVRTDDPTFLDVAKVPQTGIEATHLNSLIQFRKRKNQEAFEDKASAVHTIGTFAGLTHIREVYSASGDATGVAEISTAVIYDGTNEPIKWTVGSAVA